ncbi:UDP-N-acetylglucosamine transporter yea4 [Cladophialophora carrionii]|uniref:UDP-N-acetylglucosamine transporter yea4 n=1 Tax=Cladophialophora carrionii TaxID=86049 RepID=A0A1C1D0A7_9EURO|nr:UDP-N-acetylglucosamine transporter yea4 [Cladophialophora carrionii]
MTSQLDSAARKRREPSTHEPQPHANGEFTPNGTVSQSKSKSVPSSPATPEAPSSTTLSILQIWAPTLILIFGGCCSNVYTLESLISASPSSGSLLTASQFLLVSLFTLPRHFSPSCGVRNLFLKERNIPIRKWVIYTAYFLSINILNNTAFRYKIGIPLHIILRSAGPVTTMLAGRFVKGRRYPAQKVVAVVLLFVGVVVAAFSDAAAKQTAVQATTAAVHEDDGIAASTRPSTGAAAAAAGGGAWSQTPGFALLASALVLSACMGLYSDDMYATHGRSGDITAETLFYSHAMSLPWFLGQIRPLTSEFFDLMAVPVPVQSKPSFSPSSAAAAAAAPSSPFSSPSVLLDRLSSTILLPRPVLLLAANAATQLLCIVGVNRLSAQSSSLTVSIVLNIRKLVSLVLSIWLFGNELPWGVLLGATVVFVGGGLYALPARETDKGREKTKKKTK